MKTTVRISLSLFLLLLIGIYSLNAQTNNDTQTFAFNKTEAIVVNDITYVKFLISEPSENVIYVVQRSEDGENFTDLFLKKGVQSPHKIPLLYCCKDFQSTSKTVYYRVKRVVNDDVSYSQVFFSKPINVQPEPVMAQDVPEIK